MCFRPLTMTGWGGCLSLSRCFGFAGAGETTAPFLSSSTLPGKGPGPGGGGIVPPDET